jgi:hypothetical protein
MLLAVLAFAASAHLFPAELPTEPRMSVTPPAPMLVDYQDPAMLPRRFRNHCGFDPILQRYYCSNSCGADYQFYYCSAQSFGCCDIGRGYCDQEARLRCSPFNPVLFPELRSLPPGGGPPIESGDFWHPFRRR